MTANFNITTAKYLAISLTLDDHLNAVSACSLSDYALLVLDPHPQINVCLLLLYVKFLKLLGMLLHLIYGLLFRLLVLF